MVAISYMSLGENIKRTRKAKKLTQKELAEKLGISESMFSLYESDKSDITVTKLMSLAQVLNVPVYSLLGNESILDLNLIKEGEEDSSEEYLEAIPIQTSEEEFTLMTANGMQFQQLKDGRYRMFIPLVEQHAYAGYLAGWKDPEYIQELPKHVITVDQIHQGIYKAFAVRGDSMDDGSRESICEGDIVDARRLPSHFWEHKLHYHEYPDFVIVHQDGVVIKRIVDHDVKKGILYCKSLNPNKELYPDSFYRLSEVYELYNIVSLQQKRRRSS